MALETVSKAVVVEVAVAHRQGVAPDAVSHREAAGPTHAHRATSETSATDASYAALFEFCRNVFGVLLMALKDLQAGLE